jgi:hypothetical protein
VTGSIEKVPYALIEMLRAQIPQVQNRVNHLGSGQLVQAQCPRITVSAPTANSEEQRWIGEHWGITNRGVMKRYILHIDVWDRNPKVLEQVAANVETAIWKNRGYHPADYTYGYFVDMEISGGSATGVDAASQLYRRTVSVSALWLDLNTY